MTGEDVLDYARNACLTKSFPASELADIVYDMDYATIGRVLSELHGYYEGGSYTFNVDGHNLLEEILIHIVLDCIEHQKNDREKAV